MLTAEQAAEYLASQGIDNVPSFVLAGWLEQAAGVAPCLEANYSPATATLIQAYLLALFALGQADKYISSQTAPSGASRSFRYQSFSDRWRAQLALLRGLDTAGCTADLVPPDPTGAPRGAMFVATGGCL